MPTNKFPLVYNFFDEQQKENYTTSNPIGMAKSVGGVLSVGAPILAAAAYANSRISTNEYRGIAGLRSNAIGDASAKVGDSLRAMQESQNEIRKINQDKFKKKLLDGNFLDEISKETERGQRAILNGILEALNETGIDAQQAAPLKQTLEELVQAEILKIDDNARNTLKSVFGSIKDSNPDFYGRMSKNINFYKDIKDSLAAPLKLSHSSFDSSFTRLDTNSLNGKAKGRFDAIKNAFANTNFNIEAVQVDEKVGNMNSKALYAKIKSGKTFNMIPIDLSDVTESIGAPLVRLGHGQQSFVSPMAIGRADVIKKEFLDKGQTFSTKDIERSLKGSSKTGPFQQIEDFIISNLLEMKEKSGKLNADSIKALNEDIRGISESLNRTFNTGANADEFAKLAKSQIRSLGSAIGFVLDGLNIEDRTKFSANVIASQADMGLLTGHSNLQISSMNNFNIVNLFMTDGMRINMNNTFQESIGKGSARSFNFIGRGLESSFHIGGAKVSDVTHAVLPLTARPKQFWNNTNFFADSVGPGASRLDKRTGRALMLLDMKEGRLGLSEGESYLSKGLITKKIFPKTVLDPKTMGYAGTDLLNELVRRVNANEGNLIIESGSVFKLGEQTIGIGDIEKHPSQSKVTKYYEDIDMFFRQEGNKTGALTLGKLDGNVSEVPFFRGTKRLELGIVERTTDTGADLYRIVGMADLEDLYPKLFSEETKTTVRPLDDRGISELQKRYTNDLGIKFGSIDITGGSGSGTGFNNFAKVIGATEGSMLKKAHYYHARQIASAAEAFAMARGMDGESAIGQIVKRAEDIRSEAAKAFNVNNDPNFKFKNIKSVTDQQKIFTRSFVESVSEFMGSKQFSSSGGHVTADELGRTFGGFYTAFQSQGKEFSSMTSDEVMGILRKNISGDDPFFKTVEIEIQKGLAISLSNLRPGPDLATYRSNQASMEARMFNFLGMKVHKVGGMSADETADFLFSLMSRKSDAGNELVALREYLQFHEYAKSQESVFAAGKFKAMERVSLNDFVSMVSDESLADDRVDKFLKSKEGGFLLDFGENTSASKALNKIFKGKGSMYIPAGEKFMEAIASQGTEMIKREGTVRLSGEYKNQIKYFAENISEFMNPNQSSMEETRKAETVVRNFENKISEITGNSFKNIMKGKLKGSASLRSAGIKLDPMRGNQDYMNSGYYGGEVAKRVKAKGQNVADSILPSLDVEKASRRQMQEISDLAMKSRNTQVVFAETQGFLAAMSDFIEGAKHEYAQEDISKKGKKITAGSQARHGQRMAKLDAAEKFQHFFLGSYKDYARNFDKDGLMAIVSRHPMLSSGHVQMTALYRHVSETQGKDEYLRNLIGRSRMGDEKLQLAMAQVYQEFGKDIFNDENFEKLSKATAKGLNRKQQMALTGQRGLFTYMAENISAFQQGEGGGRIFFPDMEVDVHYGQDKVRRINFSLASAAIGDMDGDLFQLIMPSQKQAKNITQKLMSQSAKDAAADEMLYRASLRMLFDEAGEGIGNLSKVLGDATSDPSRFLKDVAMKEILHKQVGPIDVALDSIRLGMVNMDFNKNQLRSVQTGLAFLTVLEEVGTIKAKKLPKAIDFASIIANAANEAYDTGDVSKLRNITENFVFKGTDLSKGFDIKGLDLTGISNKETRNLIESAFKRAKNGLINIDEVFEMIAAGAVHGKRIGSRYTKTSKAMRMVATNQNQSTAKLSGYIAAANESLVGRMTGKDESFIQQKTRTVLNEAGDIFNRLSDLGNKKMLTPAIAGIAGALGLAGILGSSGSRPEPLLMPGEVTDNALGERIAAGQLYDNRGSYSNMENYSRQSEINERPILTGETRVQRNSGMMINGELPNQSAIQRVQQIMSSIGGNANYVINDTRGPMTMNFVNKHMGE